MAGPIIILRPSGNVYDWSIQFSEKSAPMPTVTDSKQGDYDLNEIALQQGLHVQGLTQTGWMPAQSASAIFGGVQLIITDPGTGGALEWRFGGQPMSAINPSPPWGWNPLLRKVTYGSMSIVPSPGGAAVPAYEIKIL